MSLSPRKKNLGNKRPHKKKRAWILYKKGQSFINIWLFINEQTAWLQ